MLLYNFLKKINILYISVFYYNFFFLKKKNFWENNFWFYVDVLNNNNKSLCLFMFLLLVLFSFFLKKNWINFFLNLIFFFILICFIYINSLEKFQFFNLNYNCLNSINLTLVNGLILIHPVCIYFTYLCIILHYLFWKYNYNFLNYCINLLKSFLLIFLFTSLIAVILGGWWAQQELNWGGWWNWDYVEVIAFIFFLKSVILSHTSIINNYNFILTLNPTILFNLVIFFLLIRVDFLNSIHSFSSITITQSGMCFFLLFFLNWFLFFLKKKYDFYKKFKLISFFLKKNRKFLNFFLIINNVFISYILISVVYFYFFNFKFLDLIKFIKFLTYIYMLIFFIKYSDKTLIQIFIFLIYIVLFSLNFLFFLFFIYYIYVQFYFNRLKKFNFFEKMYYIHYIVYIFIFYAFINYSSVYKTDIFTSFNLIFINNQFININCESSVISLNSIYIYNENLYNFKYKLLFNFLSFYETIYNNSLTIENYIHNFYKINILWLGYIFYNIYYILIYSWIFFILYKLISIKFYFFSKINFYLLFNF